MPYIPEDKRDLFSFADWKRAPKNPGELNYIFSTLADMYLRSRTLYKTTYTYTDLNDVMGAFESAKQEFYRRVVVPYEDKKRATNGDVY